MAPFSQEMEPPQLPGAIQGVALQPLLKVNEVAVLPRDHSLCRKARLQPLEFTGERFISLAVGDPYRTAIDAMFEDAKVHRATLF
jgi:DNA-binding transcriptional LysR family regulator